MALSTALLAQLLRSSPHQKGRFSGSSTWAAPSAALFYWELFATFPLTNDESISTLFRVEKDSIYFGMVLSAPWLTQTADQ
jgi:hypothetical protein